MVGAVIVRDGVEIARGHHKKFGGPHAEIEAMRAWEKGTGSAAVGGACPLFPRPEEQGQTPISDESCGAAQGGVGPSFPAPEKGDRHGIKPPSQSPFSGLTMYVTLEPCCHRNKKTPPCTEAIIPSGISRVVVAMEDPDVNVRGRGVAALRAAGIEVTVGVCEAAARKLLAAYIKLRTLGRPWVIAKWAQTADGYLALPAGQGRWISNELSRAHVHQVRGVCDGVVVGIGTVLADDPMLNCRRAKSEERCGTAAPGCERTAKSEEQGSFRQPLRVVLDCDLRIPLTSRLVQTVREFPLAIITSPEGLERKRAKAQVLQDAGAEVVAIDPRGPGRVDLDKLLVEMGRRQWTRVLFEGGPAVLRETLDLGLADEVMVYVSPAKVGAVCENLPRLDIAELAANLHMTVEEERSFGADRWFRYCRS
jgi:diaminohydroxyphosphoribosylaminopyrimidine deaminase/5-amino-6-(5-phosphoribosylamino)uracil reductase